MAHTNHPTFRRWLTHFEFARASDWRIAPWWKLDTRAAQQQTLLRLLATAARQRLAFAPVVLALAEEHQWGYRWRLGKLAERLDAGMPLADAVEQTPGVLSPEQTLAVRFGMESGALPAVLAAAIPGQNDAVTATSPRLRSLASYVAALVVVAGFIIVFLLHKILPELQSIFYEFSLELPSATHTLLGFGHWCGAYWWVVALVMLIGGWLLFSQRGWRYVHRDWLPRLSRSAAQLRIAEVMRLLAVALEAGRPLSGSISTLARYYYDPRVRGALLFVRNEMELGAPVWQSLREAGALTDVEVTALESAIDPSARIWTLCRLADQRGERVAARIDFAIELLQPLAVLMLAGGVLLVSLAVLGPLNSVISTLS